ncbi:hypothetical protein Hanom_Chr10g00910901 [Helianthus anomalus]
MWWWLRLGVIRLSPTVLNFVVVISSSSRLGMEIRLRWLFTCLSVTAVDLLLTTAVDGGGDAQGLMSRLIFGER